MRSKLVWLSLLLGATGAGYVWREPLLANPTIADAARTLTEKLAGYGIKLPDAGPAAPGAPKAPPETAAAPAAGPPGAKGRGGPPPAPVTAAIAIEGDMPIILTAPGAVEPMATVAIRPRVDGQIVKVGFAEGDLVKEGQVLFQLDERLVKAQITQAEANIARDTASLKDAESTLGRRETLVRQKYATEASIDTQRATVESLKAGIAAGRALLDMQKTQLDYLVIRAPITGRTGNVTTKLGTTVRAAEPTAMVTINQTKPIAITFALPQTELDPVRGALTRKSTARITIPGPTPRIIEGTIAFVDNQVDKQTGTISAKVTAPNAEETLWPGQAVEVALTVDVQPRIVSVPASAVLPAAEGMIAWIIGADNKVAPRKVTLLRIVGQTAFVQEGIKAGERVVTDGQIRLAPGSIAIVQEPRPPGAVPATAPPPGAKTGPAAQTEQRPAGRS